MIIVVQVEGRRLDCSHEQCRDSFMHEAMATRVLGRSSTGKQLGYSRAPIH